MLPEKSNVTPPGLWAHLAPENLERLTTILTDCVPEVFRLTRVIEHETGFSSEIGRNMLVDVLSHLGTLASRIDLTAVQQASQVSKIEEHLRRAIIEHPEEVVRDRLGKIRDRWLDYERECYQYRETGTLSGAPRHDELESLRKRIAKLLESARSRKPDETTWEESLDAAANATQAAHLAVDLADKLEQCIGIGQTITRQRERDADDLRRQEERDVASARQNRRTNRQWLVALVVAIAIAVTSFFIGKDHPNGHAKAPRTVTSTRTTP